MKKNTETGEHYLETPDPFPAEDLNQEEPLTNSLEVVDMTDHAAIEGKALRVELRRTRDPATAEARAKPTARILDSNFVVGLLSPDHLPCEGENFRLAYHSWNAYADYGLLDSYQPIRNMIQEGDCYYFETDEGQWRLKVLDSGN